MNQLSAEHGYASLSLREVAREAGIAPTSFYRHFQNMEELGLSLVDEGGLALRQLLRQSRLQIARGGSIIRSSVTTFMSFVANQTPIFRLLLQEKSGNSRAFRLAVQREVDHFTAELVDYLVAEQHYSRELAELQADAIVRIVFGAGADAIDADDSERQRLTERTIAQVRMVARGADATRQLGKTAK